MTRRTTTAGGLFGGMDYQQAVELVDGSPGASALLLRHRISEDRQRSLLASVHDAQVLCALQRLRVDTMLDAMRRLDRS